MSVALKAQSVSIAFGGVAALQDVSIDFPQREIIGIIGPNGAGKTTLLNVICGMTPPDEGEVFLHEVSLTGMKPSHVASLGLRRTFQSSQLFPGMSVLENMMCGLHLMGSTKLFGAIFRSPAMVKIITRSWSHLLGRRRPRPGSGWTTLVYPLSRSFLWEFWK